VRSTSRSISAGDDRLETPGALRLVFQTQPRSVKSDHGLNLLADWRLFD
jgi:hypothetical protein